MDTAIASTTKHAFSRSVRTSTRTDKEFDAIITARLYAIEQAIANNGIEGLITPIDLVERTKQCARLPIDNEEFSARGKEMVLDFYRRK